MSARYSQRSSISAFFQFGVNNAEVLPVNQYFGMGFTGFGLMPRRPADSMGVACHGHGSIRRLSTVQAN